MFLCVCMNVGRVSLLSFLYATTTKKGQKIFKKVSQSSLLLMPKIHFYEKPNMTEFGMTKFNCQFLLSSPKTLHRVQTNTLVLQ